MRVFKKLNMAGAAHIIVPILVVVGAGIIGTYTLVASHANSTQVTCSYNGHTHSGAREYNCGWSLPTPVISSSNRQVGTFYASSTNWVLCQQRGGTLHNGSYYNYWWAYAVSDENTTGWVNATYGHGGINDGSFASVPNCNGKYGAAPTQTAVYCVNRQFTRGTTSACVKDAQIMLNGIEAANIMGMRNGVRVSTAGYFDTTTANQVSHFQQRCKLYNGKYCVPPNGSYGIIEGRTWEQLCTYGADNNLGSTVASAGASAGCSHVEPY